MYTVAQALAVWFAQFELPVYLDSDVPDEASLPYITIPFREPEWDKKASFPVSVWYRSKSNVAVMQKGDQIIAAIGPGVKIPCADGYIVLYPDNPLSQLLINGDERRAYLLFTINAYHLPGV